MKGARPREVDYEKQEKTLLRLETVSKRVRTPGLLRLLHKALRASGYYRNG